MIHYYNSTSWRVLFPLYHIDLPTPTMFKLLLNNLHYNSYKSVNKPKTTKRYGESHPIINGFRLYKASCSKECSDVNFLVIWIPVGCYGKWTDQSDLQNKHHSNTDEGWGLHVHAAVFYHYTSEQNWHLTPHSLLLTAKCSVLTL